MEKAKFWKRAVAYIIDIIIVMIISSAIFAVIPGKQEVKNDNATTYKQYMNGDITAKEYIKESAPHNMETEKANALGYTITLITTILYFTILQYLLKGQTIGKKALKIKVVNNEDKEVNLKNIILRTIIINEIAFMIIRIGLILLINNQQIFYIVNVLSILDYVLIIICAITVLISDNNIGLHDKLAKTKVVNV